MDGYAIIFCFSIVVEPGCYEHESVLFLYLSPPRYITVLVEMTRFESTGQGKLIASQMLDVTIRVKEVRSFSVRQMVRAYQYPCAPLVS